MHADPKDAPLLRSKGWRWKVRQSGGHPNWNRCIYCGRFISNADFDKKRAGSDFTPDTAFSSESVDSYHIACKEA